jgi:predicted membrane protein
MPLLYVVSALVIVALVAIFMNASTQMPANIKSVVNAVVGLIVVGMVLWLINTYIPMADSIKAILNIVVIVATCVFVLQAVGLWSGAVKMAATLWARVTSPRPSDSAKPTS